MASVYERVLGERFAQLDPQLRGYFGAPLTGQARREPDGTAQAAVGHGSGVYAIAGSRHRWLWPALAWLAWRRVLFPEYGHDIPFEIVNTTHPDGTLSARRTFTFPGRTRVMEDTMSVVDGALHDRLGRRRGLEVEFTLEIVDGGLHLRSRRQWLHLGIARFRMPGLVRVTLAETAAGGLRGVETQRVDVRMTAPVLGEVFRYAGSFTYSVVD
jgi:Domain of unknown function (DUF4166)